MHSRISAIRKLTGVIPLLTILLAGCGQTGSQAFGLNGSLINIVPASVSFGTNPGMVTANASCPTSQQLLGGGFLLDGEASVKVTGVSNPIPAVTVTQNYPSSTTTWTVSAEALTEATQLANVAVFAFAYCYVPSKPRLNITSHSATILAQATPPSLPVSLTANASGIASCPSGAVVTGGGYRLKSSTPFGDALNSYITSSEPISSGDSDGWSMTFQYPNTIKTPPDADVYALCAGANLPRGLMVHPVPPPTGSQTTSSTLSVSCPTYAFSTGGGYSYSQTAGISEPDPYNFLSSYATSQNGWQATPRSHKLVPTQTGAWQVAFYSEVSWQTVVSAYCIRFPTAP
jgi:hypothetical protein